MNDVLGNALNDYYKIIATAKRSGKHRSYTLSAANLWVHHRLTVPPQGPSPGKKNIDEGPGKGHPGKIGKEHEGDIREGHRRVIGEEHPRKIGKGQGADIGERRGNVGEGQGGEPGKEIQEVPREERGEDLRKESSGESGEENRVDPGGEPRREVREEPREEMPVNVFFRDMEEMPELEWVALHRCRGKILDIGAGAGSHALALQKMGQDITALDISPGAVAVMKARGVEKVVEGDFFQLDIQEMQFDTLLLLMNGIGISGTLDGLRRFLAKARTLLRPGGQLIFDSSNVAYLYGGRPPKTEGYYGEIMHQYEYRGQRSDWFKWLFIDRKTLKEIAIQEGWSVSLLFEDPWDQFLVRCRPR